MVKQEAGDRGHLHHGGVISGLPGGGKGGFVFVEGPR
jgi:hypothetical protein